MLLPLPAILPLERDTDSKTLKMKIIQEIIKVFKKLKSSYTVYHCARPPPSI